MDAFSFIAGLIAGIYFGLCILSSFLDDNKRGFKQSRRWAKGIDMALTNNTSIQWHWVDECLPDKTGEYLVTYHPCNWNDVDESKTEVGLDTFHRRMGWARHVYQRVVAWAEKPSPCSKQRLLRDKLC